MKRALAIMVAVCTVGFASFAMSFSGSWTANICALPFGLTSSLVLNYDVAGFTITSTSGFGISGLTSQKFGLKGAFGPFTIGGNMWFTPSPAAYLASDLVTGFDFGGIALGLTVYHWVPGGYQAAWGTDPCLEIWAPDAVGGLQYTITGKLAPIDLRVRFLDCCSGSAFQDLRVIITPIPLCCGVNLTGTFMFSKSGFTSLGFTGLNVPICCGISMDIGITYTTTAKSVTITPKFAGIVEGCFEVFGRPQFSTEFAAKWTGIFIDGFRIKCTIADCNYIEYVHVFTGSGIPAGTPPVTIAYAIPTSVPLAIRNKLSAACLEYEYVELGFCGAGCCGGKYEVTLRMLWGYKDPGLFGLTRFVGSAKIPVMANFTVNLDFAMPANSVAPCALPSFCMGWTFTF